MAIQIRFITDSIVAPEYDCSAHTPEQWTELLGKPQIAMGICSIVFATLCQILYIPSLRVFHRDRRLTCYKIMCFLGVVDSFGLTCVGTLFGYTMLRGLVYCSNVIISWFIGFGVCCCWYISTATCALLVINRIGEIMQRSTFLQGWRSSACMMTIMVYGVMGSLFTRIVLPNSPRTLVAFDPFIPGHSMDEYPNTFNMLHNFGISFFIPCSYIIYVGILRWKATHFESSTVTQKLQAKVFTQASIICFFNVATAAAGVVQMFVPAPNIIIWTGMIAIQSVHGAPCIIYILCNRSIMDEFRKIAGLNRSVVASLANNSSVVSSTHRSSVA